MRHMDTGVLIAARRYYTADSRERSVADLNCFQELSQDNETRRLGN